MRTIYHPMLLKLSSALTIIFFVFAGCSAVDIKKVTYQKADYYKFTSQKAGLRISVDPYIQEDRLKEFFGCDMLSRGILPVFVVLENENAEDGYILVKEKTGLIMKTPSQMNSTNKSGGETYTSDELEKAVKTEETILNLGWVLSPIGIMIPLVIADKKVKDERAIKRNVEEIHLGDKTIYQGGSNSGFLYFGINDKTDINKIEGLLLTMKNIRSKETMPLIININQ